MYENHKDLFDQIEHICAKVLLLRWTTVAKHTSVPDFVRRHLQQLSLVMKQPELQSIIDAGADWLTKASPAVLSLASQGICGEGMFSVRVRDIIESNAQECVSKAIDAMLQKHLDETRAFKQPVLVDVQMIED